MAAAGLGHEAERRVRWLSTRPPEDDAAVLTGIERFIKENGFTAVIPSSQLPMRCLDQLVRQQCLRVPEQVSVVNFEQDHQEKMWLGMSDPTTVRFPMREMGRRLAELATMATERKLLPPLSIFPAELVEGSSVRSLKADETRSRAEPAPVSTSKY
jgi:DNA-binding LacI/PurR family transcriptional regulator